MSKVIFVLKMFIVGERFKVSNHDRIAIKKLTEFIIYVYVYYWFKIPLAADAPILTIQLWQDLKSWELNDKKISVACQKKLDRHTWYIMARHVVFAFWSQSVDDSTKEAMAKALITSPKEKIDLGKPELPRMKIPILLNLGSCSR